MNTKSTASGSSALSWNRATFEAASTVLGSQCPSAARPPPRRLPDAAMPSTGSDKASRASSVRF